MKIQESGENYLETILILQGRNGNVRSIDIATELGFSKPSVSRAMSILRKAGYLVMEENGLIHLTEEGLSRAKEVYSRHELIADFLSRVLGVGLETAEKDACRIEHVISEETVRRMQEYLRNLK